MSYENSPGNPRENENNQELTQEDIELRNQIFEDDAAMVALRKVRPNMSLEDFNSLGHDDLNELSKDIEEYLKSEENHEGFLNLVGDYDFALASSAAQELGIEVRTANQLRALSDFDVARIYDRLDDKYGQAGGEQATTEAAHEAAMAAARAEMYASAEQARQAEVADAIQSHLEEEAEKIQRAEAEDAVQVHLEAEADKIEQAEADEAAQNTTESTGRPIDVDVIEPKEAEEMKKAAEAAKDAAQATREAQGPIEVEAKVIDSDAETGEKKKRRGFGRRVLSAIVGLGILGGGLFGFTKSSNDSIKAKATAPEKTYTVTFDELSSQNHVEAAEANEGIWDAATGNDARGLFADENDPTRVNPDKLGEHNLVDDEEFANEDLSTEQGVKQFKEHFVKVNERQAVNMAMFADYMKNHGGDKYIPESIRGLSGEALENAIVDNQDGCYTELCRNFEEFVNSANVRKGELTAGQYDNYFATQVNPDAVLTKDNIELMKTTTFEKDGTPCFVFENGGITYVVKEVCAQAVTTIDQQPPVTTTPEVTTTTTTTTPLETTTTTTTSTTPETTTSTTTTPVTTTTTTTSTTPIVTTTPMTTTTIETTTTSYDNSKSEEGLARGQGGYVSPVEEGPRVTENMYQNDYNPATTTTAEMNFAAQNANSEFASDINDTFEGAAIRQQREQAASEQAAIDQARNNDVAAQPSYIDLNSDSY